MAKQLHTLMWGITTTDPGKWPAELAAAAESDTSTGSYSEWAVSGLKAAMEAAGREYVAKNSALFATDLV